ncbi:hypothetical protein BH11PLA1_BH11PLA1_01610 [soil metagenome]
MKKLIKILVALAAVVVLLLVAAVVIVYLSINAIAKSAVEKGGSYALGVPTTVSSVSVGLLSGNFTLNTLQVANPPGFTEPAFLTLGKGAVSADLSTLTSQTVVIPEFLLDDITLDLEKNAGGANYGVIVDNLKRVSGGDATKPAQPDPDAKKFVINLLRIRNIKVKATLVNAPGALGGVINKAAAVNVALEEIQLKDVGKTGTGVGGTGVTSEQLSAIIVQAVMAAVAEKSGGLIDPSILNDLRGKVAQLGSLRELGVGAVDEVIGAAGKLGQDAADKVKAQVGEKINEAKDKLGERIGDSIGDKLKGVLPGKK